MKQLSRSLWAFPFTLALGLSGSCASNSSAPTSPTTSGGIPPSKTDQAIAALAPAKLAPSDATRAIDAAIAAHFQRNATQRAYVMTDKPLYQPGETIWFRADLRATGTLVGAQQGMRAQLISPRGATVFDKRILAQSGVGQNDFALPDEIEGGEYTIQLTADTGAQHARRIIVNTYEAPRLKKTVELLKKAYGAGDQVSAAIEVRLATGEPLGNRPLTGIITIDDVETARVPITTDKDGKATARFQLPSQIARGDGLFTVLVEDGGVTESIQKRIPIVMKTIAFEMFPEGGDLVEGLPGRVYFAAKNTLGKPADVEGKVTDDRGATVATFTSIHDGMGRFELSPLTDRTYKVEITKPANIAGTFTLPAAKPGGCVVRSIDDQAEKIRVAAICTTARTIDVEAVLREKRVAGGAVEVAANTPALVELPVPADAQGAVRVTLFSTKNEPLAERLVYHGRGRDLTVAVTAERASYSPRDPVKLKIKATDASGKPVAANLGVAVVDDTVLSFADDKSARMLARMYLEPELGVTSDPATAIEEPNYYFSKKPEAPAALDALLATRGYRRFEWQPVFNPPPPQPEYVDDFAMDMAPRGGAMEPRAPRMAPQPAPPPAQAPGQDVKRLENKVAKADVADKQQVARGPMPVMKRELEAPRDRRGGAAGRAMVDEDWVGDERVASWAPVRVFPVPAYGAPYAGPRTDFRETIYWNPSVVTKADGTAEVAFFTNDAITSFRASVEGVSSGGIAGAGEAVFQSKMPVSLDARLPVEVTQGDRIMLPVTIANETDRAMDADLTATFGAAFRLAKVPSNKLRLAPHQKQTIEFPLDVVATGGNADVEIALATAGLRDQVKKQIRVVPLGFPFEVAASGTAKGGAPMTHAFTLDGALPGTITASVTMYPSPLASMTKGMDAMIREPGGCFEQTSSSNYPNIMILGYLNANSGEGGVDPALVEKTAGVLDRGYKLLTGYETKQQGYEWFGQTPGHEALTAYGLMEFADMGKVYDVDKKMVERTSAWLMSRRDGKGGFQRSSQALDSFGRASEPTTNAYIMWALAEANRTAGMTKELEATLALGASTRDPYLLALAANTALLAKAPQAASLVKRLVELQGKDGSFANAKESITMSGGESLAIEATSLATLALLKASPNNEYESQIRTSVDWLNAKRGGYGQWSNTQATILGLKALTAYSDHARQMTSSGTAKLVVNGKVVGTIPFDKGRKDALVWDDVAASLRPGKNTVEVVLDGEASLPYSIAIGYRAARPQSSAATKVSVATTLDATSLKMGGATKLRAHVENTTKDGIPMALARVGIPGGMSFQTWQLKELRDKGLIDFYETRPREVILYWRAMAPSAKKDVELNLLASVPGTYEAPASSAYLYYTPEDKAWTPPVKVTIEK